MNMAKIPKYHHHILKWSKNIMPDGNYTEIHKIQICTPKYASPPPIYGANFITVSEMFELPRTSNSFTGVGYLVSVIRVL